MKTHYNITIDNKVVNEAKEIMEEYGGKLSPVIENLLKAWVKRQKKIGEVED